MTKKDLAYGTAIALLTLFVVANIYAGARLSDRVTIEHNALVATQGALVMTQKQFATYVAQNNTNNSAFEKRLDYYYALLLNNNTTGLYKMGCYPIEVSAITTVNSNTQIILAYYNPMQRLFMPLVCPK